MIGNLADDIAYLLVQNKIVAKEKRDYYRYGAEVVLLNMLIVFVTLVITIVTETWLHFVSFLFIFVPLRIFAGGIHSKSSELCLAISTIAYITSIVIAGILNNFNFNWLLLIPVLLSLVFIIVMAPVEHKNNPLGKKSRKKNRIISILLAGADSVIFVVLSVLKSEVASSVMTFVILATILMIIGKIHNCFQVDNKLKINE